MMTVAATHHTMQSCRTIRAIEEWAILCPACRVPTTRKFLLPYRGRKICVPCFLSLVEGREACFNRERLPLHVRARGYLERGDREG